MADEPPPRDGGSTSGADGPRPERRPFRRYFAPDDDVEPAAEESPATGPARDDAWFRRAPSASGRAPRDEDWYGDETGRTDPASPAAPDTDDRPSPYFNVPERRGGRPGATRRPQTPKTSTPPAPPNTPDTTSEPEPESEPAEPTSPRPEPDDRPSPYFNAPARRPAIARRQPGPAEPGKGARPGSARPDPTAPGGPRPGEAARQGSGREPARPDGSRAGGTRPDQAREGRAEDPRAGSGRPEASRRDGARPEDTRREEAGDGDASRLPARRDGHDGTARLRFPPRETPASRDDDTPRDPRTSRAHPAATPSAPQAPDDAHGGEDPQDLQVPADQGDSADAEAPRTAADTAAQPRTLRRGRGRKHRQTRATAKRLRFRSETDTAATERSERAEDPRDEAGTPVPEPANTPDSPASSPADPSGGSRDADAAGGGDGSDTPGGTDGFDGDEPPEDPNTPEPSGRRRLAAALWPPRVSRAQLVVGILLFALGAALAIQVRSNTESDPLRGARESDLVRVLDELEQRTARLDSEKSRLEIDKAELESSNNAAEEARAQTDQRAQVLGILAGTVKATGPGITLTITDPKGAVTADMLLDTLQELRAAGAEAVQVNQVRVVAETHFNQSAPGGPIFIDEQPVTQPYVFKVIGNPQDLEPALNIPGGVIRTLERKEAQAVVVPSQQVVVDALRVPTTPDYARSAPDAGNDG